MNKSRITIQSILFYFVLYSCLGWILELIYRSTLDKSFVFPGYFMSQGFPIPFLPIYGFGALILLFLYKKIEEKNIFIRMMVYGITMSVVEFIGGVFSVHVLGVRLWDYSSHPFNVYGHVSLFQSFLWVIAGLAFEKIHPKVTKCFT